MRTFFKKILLFGVIVLAIDMAVGCLFPIFIAHVKGGDTMRDKYICNETSEDILVFGSSRALRHYNPVIISDSTGLSCYNCGQGGNGVILNYARLQQVTERYAPKYIIYDVLPEYDLLAGDDNHKYLERLKAFYDKKGVEEVFESVDPTEKYKMLSRMYRYNSRFVQIISDCIRPLMSMGTNGFRPFYGEMIDIKDKTEPDKPAPVFDSLKLQYFNRLADFSSRSRLIFVVSPIWGGMDERDLAPVKRLCEQHGIPLIDFSNDSKYVHVNKYFFDTPHLNSVGADEFTKDLMKRLKSEIEFNQVP